MAAGKFGGKLLTSELRKLGTEAHDMEPDGTPLTRAECLARLIWRRALGWEERTRDAEGNLKVKQHPPESWAMQFIWERTEGKAPNAISEDTGGRTAAQTVRELTKDRLNRLSAKLVAPAGPPKFAPPGTSDA